MWPFGQAETKRTGTTGLRLPSSTNLRLCSWSHRTSRRRRHCALRGESRASLTMNQVGKIRAPTGAARCAFSSWRGGVKSSRIGVSRIRWSFATSRGSFTFSRRRVAQSCNPDTMTEYLGRSIIAPGPQVVINWLWRMTLSFIEAARVLKLPEPASPGSRRLS